MPSIVNARVVGSGELVTDSAAFVDAQCSSTALTNGVTYFALGLANHRNDGGNTWGSRVEGRFGSTRLGLSEWRSIFGQFNTGDDVGGAAPMFVGVVTGNGTDTLNMRAAGNDTLGGENIRVGGQSWTYFALTDLTATDDYDFAEMTSDTVSATPTTDTWIEGDAAGQLDITPTETGDWMIVAYCEAVTQVGAAATNEIRARLQLVADPAGTPSPTTIGAGAQYSSIQATNADHFSPSLHVIDVRTLTGGTTYRVQWEFSNEASHDEIGYRRERIYAFRLGAFRGNASITNGGGIQDLTGAETEAASGLTHNFSPGGEDVLVFASAPTQNDGNWADHWLRLDGTPDVDFPGAFGEGRMHAMVETDFPGSDIVDVQQVGRLAAASGSNTWRLVAQADGAPGVTYGRDRGNTTDARSVLVALEMFAVEAAYELEADPTGSMAMSATGGAIEALFAAVGGGMASAATGSLGFGLATAVAGAMAASATGEAVYELEAAPVGSMAASATGGAVEVLEAAPAGAMASAVTGGFAFTLEAAPAGSMLAAATGAAVFPVEAAPAGSMASAATGGFTFTLAADAAGAMTSAATGVAVFPMAAAPAGTMTSAAAGYAVPDVDDLIGGIGNDLALRVLGVDEHGILRPRVGDTRPVRFELLDIAGEAIDHELIESVTVQVRRASDPTTAITEVEPEAETETDADDVVYTWRVDLSDTITVSGQWVLEADVVLIDGTEVTWPSAGPLKIRVVEGVG